ncbi:hypothetical protein H6G76_31140 [Nostoc sp. FACHB-152]|uniref:VMAP-C domain-containing protein n=1 Tax=unclassified Nostoc TaxID=2593658 RepID=UPI001684A2CD|nr:MULTISPECIES: hypothetical protein [unclassified Nostoc]MBD2451494.1 hypothetical protein [Nostoc sp. FACHB-152]MBD2469056.1 hypothetical protein [Nostoc sp. FACHB-145]
MADQDNLNDIIERILKGSQTEDDIEQLRRSLAVSDNQIVSQLGKYNVNIGEGKDIHIGDRTYQQWNKEAMKALVKAIRETSGIHQNTQGGDAAARDIDKSITFKNCTIIQLLAKDSNLGNVSPGLLNKSYFSGIPLESIQQAYQEALPPDADVWNLEGNDITQILQVIEEFRKSLEFVKQLSQDENIPQEIRDKLSGLAEELAAKKHSGDKTKPPTDFSSIPKGQLESYLIATIERCDDDNEQFLMNAWLIIDDSLPVNDLSKFISLLDKDEQQLGILCKFNEIPQQLNRFLKKSLRLLRGKQYQLIIEVFLPSDLIGTEVDRWKISDPILEEITLGIKYPIRLRSLERLNLDYLDSYLSDWYKYWDRVIAVLHNEAVQELFEHLKEIESFNWKILKNNLQYKIGLKVTCAPPKAKIKDLFKAILISTTPIAIWTRCDIDIPNFDQVTAIDEVLSFRPLCHLCESVRQTREEADAQTEEHLGFHLALLWEDPHRLTPNVMLQLTTPGQ